MKIYQIHKYKDIGFEDVEDIIMSSYLDYNKALIEKERLQQEELKLQEQAKKCNDCLFIKGCWRSTTKDLTDAHSDYCNKASLKATMWGIKCNNYFSHWNDATFEIVEVDVIE